MNTSKASTGKLQILVKRLGSKEILTETEFELLQNCIFVLNERDVTAYICEDETIIPSNGFEEHYQASQARKWKSGDYVDHCKGCAGEDCPCCQYNPNL